MVTSVQPAGPGPTTGGDGLDPAAPADAQPLAGRPFEAACDSLSPNRNLTPVTTRLDGEDRLMVGGCRLSDLARIYGTPLYVLDEASLRSACRAYRHALETFYPGPSLALYASKANSSLAITALVASDGLGLDAVSAGELLTAITHRGRNWNWPWPAASRWWWITGTTWSCSPRWPPAPAGRCG
jgi:diaminopimelate decarboxylase